MIQRPDEQTVLETGGMGFINQCIAAFVMCWKPRSARKYRRSLPHFWRAECCGEYLGDTFTPRFELGNERDNFIADANWRPEAFVLVRHWLDEHGLHATAFGAEVCVRKQTLVPAIVRRGQEPARMPEPLLRVITCASGQEAICRATLLYALQHPDVIEDNPT